MPLTIQFGPWAPDLSDTPMQIPDQQGPVVVPCADILNVFYSNGSYRSVASPVAATIDGNTIQPISIAPVSAFSFYDNVAQQETVFAGTAVGVQQLNPNGTWSLISLVTSQSVQLAGFAMATKLGSFLNTSQLSAQIITLTVGKFATQLTGITFVAGQNSTITPGNLKLGIPATTTVKTGYSVQAPVVGSTSGPSGAFGGTILTIADTSTTFAGVTGITTTLVVASLATDPTQSAFAILTAAGTGLTSASAAYTFAAGVARWVWNGQVFGFAPGSTYPLVFT